MIYFTEQDIDRLIEDDAPLGDLTSFSMGLSGKKGKISLRARHEMVACCTEEAARVYTRAGLSVLNCTPSGVKVAEGALLLEAEGDAAAIHTAWKAGSVLVEFASGIATRTRFLFDAARSVNPQTTLAGTRKHPPYLKKVAMKALMAGGGVPHRTGLSDTILIFREHLIFVGGMGNINQIILNLKQCQKEKKIVAEAHTTEEAVALAKAGADAIQVDKMSPRDFANCVRICKSLSPEIKMLAAGGINPGNAREYAQGGADVLVSSWMYFAPPADITVEIRASE